MDINFLFSLSGQTSVYQRGDWLPSSLWRAQVESFRLLTEMNCPVTTRD